MTQPNVHYNVITVTNKPKRVSRNIANAIDQIIAKRLLGYLRVFQIDLEGGISISGTS